MINPATAKKPNAFSDDFLLSRDASLRSPATHPKSGPVHQVVVHHPAPSPTDHSKAAATKAGGLKMVIAGGGKKKPAYEKSTSVSAAFAGDYKGKDHTGKIADASLVKAKAASVETDGSFKHAQLAEKKKMIQGPVLKLQVARNLKKKADTEVAAWEHAVHATEADKDKKWHAFSKASVKASHNPHFRKLEENTGDDFAKAGEKLSEAKIKLGEAKAKQKKLSENYASLEADVASKSPKITSIESDGEDMGYLTVKTDKGEKKYSKAKIRDGMTKIGDYVFIPTGKGQYDTYYNPESNKAPVIDKPTVVAAKGSQPAGSDSPY